MECLQRCIFQDAGTKSNIWDSKNNKSDVVHSLSLHNYQKHAFTKCGMKAKARISCCLIWDLNLKENLQRELKIRMMEWGPSNLKDLELFTIFQDVSRNILKLVRNHWMGLIFVKQKRLFFMCVFFFILHYLLIFWEMSNFITEKGIFGTKTYS